jgi:hypothetical protein
MRMSLLAACAALGFGCASQPPPDPFLAGFHVDPPGPGQIQVHTEILPDIQPGADITFCSYLDYKMSKELDVTGYKGFQTSPGGHHNILYAVNHSQPPGSHECTEDDMTNVHYLGGGGTDGTIKADDLPPGIVFRVEPATQLMIVSHFINASDDVISGQTAYNVTVETPKAENSPADLFTIVNTMMIVPPGTSHVHTECTLQQDMQLFMLGPHAHEHATRTVLTKTAAAGGAVTTVQDIPWSADLIFNTPLVKFTKDQPFTFAAGDKFAIDCTFDNTTGSDIPFPSEMCIGYGYFFPAALEIDCVDSQWPN